LSPLVGKNVLRVFKNKIIREIFALRGDGGVKE
jgi:hypothetical protein